MPTTKRRPIEDRFWEKVDKRGPDECWNWTASKTLFGYGQIGRGRAGAGTVRAHRLSFEIHNGPVAKGALICHTCDNPACVNPSHLYLGSPSQNMRDRKDRGRATGGRRPGTVERGEDSPNAKLTMKQAADILASAETGAALALKYGVSQSQISRIRCGKRWGHLNGKKGLTRL